jgi:protein SDA1
LIEQEPSASSSSVVAFKDLIEFVSHVADRYPDVTQKFPGELAKLLSEHHAVLEYDLRDKLVGCIVLLRNKDVIDSTTLLHILFPILTTTPSKSLREMLFTKILSDLRSSNSKATSHKLNRTIQTVLYNLLESDKESAKGIWAVKITRELWKRQVWTDARTVEVMRLAALSDNEKVVAGGVRFFLGGDKEREEAAESDDEEDIDIARMRHQAGINKKNKKTMRDIRKATIAVKKKEKSKNAPHPLNFSALHLLHDPQGFAETLFSKVQSSKSKISHEVKLIVLQLVSRLVGLHKLTILSLYSFFLKHLTPRVSLASLRNPSYANDSPASIRDILSCISGPGNARPSTTRRAGAARSENRQRVRFRSFSERSRSGWLERYSRNMCAPAIGHVRHAPPRFSPVPQIER